VVSQIRFVATVENVRLLKRMQRMRSKS